MGIETPYGTIVIKQHHGNTNKREPSPNKEGTVAPNTFAEDIEQAAGGETIEGIIVLPLPEWPREDKDIPHIPDHYLNELIGWNLVKPYLNYLYRPDVAVPDRNSFFAWTATKVLFLDVRNGHTQIVHVPRNPEDIFMEDNDEH